MHLCVAGYKAVWRSPEAAGGWATDGGFPFQMRAISSLFDRTDLVVCERPELAGGPGTPLPSDGVRVVPLREPRGSDRARKLFLAGTAGYYLSRLATQVARADAVHAVVPGDVGMLGMLLALAMRKRLFVRYCSSWPDTPQTSRANRLCKRLMRRHAGGRNVMFATGLGETPPDGPAGRMRWIFSTSVQAADLETLQQVAAERLPVHGLCRMLYVGRLSPEKGLLNLLAALSLLPADPGRVGAAQERSLGPGSLRVAERAACRWQLTVAGHGSQGEELHARVAALGLGEHVRFTGLLDRAGVLRELAAADLFVLPSLTEGFPKALVEAMAAGVPVVASGVGAVPMILGNDEATGRIVPPGEVSALARALGDLAADPARRARMGPSARQRARGWTLEAWAEQIGAALEAAWGVRLKRDGAGR